MKIVICADDYGQNEAISQAIIALIKKSRLSATSCLVDSSYWPSHATWLKPLQKHVDIGLHFNLTQGKSHSLGGLLIKSYSGLLDKIVIEKELQSQLDKFVQAMGFLPNYIDGHQHILQFPTIREVLVAFYKKNLMNSNIYVRSVVSKPVRFLSKKWIIQVTGAKVFKEMLAAEGIPTNSSFSGIYDFKQAGNYSKMFPQFLAEIKNQGIIMCHPGLENPSTDLDSIKDARFHEFQYLNSEQFIVDCEKYGIKVATMNVNE